MSTSASTASLPTPPAGPATAPAGKAIATDPYPPPLIILGSPRSFTSLVCGMIGQHPQAYGVPELNLFIAGTLKEMIQELTGLRQIQLHGLMRTVSELYAGEQTLQSVDMARRWLLTRLDQRTDETYYRLCEKVAPLRIVDKSPVYSLKPEYLKRVLDAFPDARFLHLLRHPRSQGESIMNVAKGLMAILANSIDYSTETPTLDPQIAWRDMQQNILSFLESVPPAHQMQMRGEELLNAPTSGLRRICRWLGLREDEQACEAMLHPEDSPFANLGPIGAHLGNDINFLRSPALRETRIKLSTLEGPLPWRPDGKPFDDSTLELATRLGYT